MVEELLIRFLDLSTLMRMGQVSRTWRTLVSSCYIWRQLARRSGIALTACLTGGNSSPCPCHSQVARKLRWRRNLRNGKYRKLFVPSLRRNTNQEIERFSTCLDFDARRLVFGSQEGWIVVWRPSHARDDNWCRRHKISQHRIDLIHIHQDRLALLTDGSLRVYLIDEELELVLLDSVPTGSRYYERLTVTAVLGRVVFSSVAERDVTQYDMSAVSWTTFQIGQQFRVRRLELSTELTQPHLLLVIGLDTFYVG